MQYLVIPEKYFPSHTSPSGQKVLVQRFPEGLRVSGRGTLRRDVIGFTALPAMTAEQIAAAKAQKAADRAAYDLSKLVIRRRLRKAGLEAAFDAALAASPQALKDWTDAQAINTKDPLLKQMLPAMQQALGLSDAEIASLIRPGDDV
jgi:hypothetical protein